MQMLFLGSIRFDEALPVEARPDLFATYAASTTRVEYLCQDLVATMAQEPFDFYHLSDVLSYLPLDLGASLLERTHASTPKGALVVARKFVKGPAALSGAEWRRRADLEQWAAREDETSVYDFLIYEKSAAAGGAGVT